jgi:hypothetical protein
MVKTGLVKYSIIVALALAAIAGGSCGKVYDLNGADWQPDSPPSDSVFNREIQVLNLGARLPDGHVPADEEDPMFFSLEKFSSVAVGYRSTNRWDVAFSGSYRSTLSANNGGKSGFGYGTSAIGGMVVLEKRFDEVTEIPDDSQFHYPGSSGLDDQGAFGEPLGHIFYTFGGNPLRPGVNKNLESPDPAVQAEANKYVHLLYCLSQTMVDTFKNVRVLRPRTIIFKTAKGNFAKLETQSLYDGVMNPMQMKRDRSVLMPAYSFRYVVIPASERRFGFMVTRPKLTVKL